MCLASSILGSNVSTWLTPPYMNSTMHALALAGKCGFLGASGNAVDASVLGSGGRSREEAVFRQEGGERGTGKAARRFPEELSASAAARGQPSSHGLLVAGFSIHASFPAVSTFHEATRQLL